MSITWNINLITGHIIWSSSSIPNTSTPLFRIDPVLSLLSAKDPDGYHPGRLPGLIPRSLDIKFEILVSFRTRSFFNLKFFKLGLYE